MSNKNRNSRGKGRASSGSQRGGNYKGGKGVGVLELPGYEMIVPNHTYVSSELPKV